MRRDAVALVEFVTEKDGRLCSIGWHKELPLTR